MKRLYLNVMLCFLPLAVVAQNNLSGRAAVQGRDSNLSGREVEQQEEGLVRRISLEQAIGQARSFSPDAQQARHSFRAAYWNYRYYKVANLPAVNLTSNPNYDRAINKITQGDGSVKFLEQNLISADLSLEITQNVPWTGGTFFIQNTAQRLDMLGSKTWSWQTSPVNIGYSQSLFGFNSLKWNNKIEPLRYKEARRSYTEAMELVSVRAIEKFFDLARAQSDYRTAESNYAQADTLYMYAQGRYNLGTISENEMLQLEINKLTEENNRMNARIEVENCMQELRTYLGIQDGVELQVEVSDVVPDIRISLSDALLLANEHSPEILQMQRRKLESESAVAQAKANAGLKADIYLRFGLTQTADRLDAAYRNPLDQQSISVGIVLPILDWGRGKGRVRVAQSNRDLAYTQIEQQKADFTLNVSKLVNQFNLQAQRVGISARTDETAQRRAEVARKLYLSGQSSVLDLNASISEKDSARERYITALYNYWSLYYTIRSITLYDFERGRALEDETENLLVK